MKLHPQTLPARLSYTEDDLLAYAHHVWVQHGMPNPSAAWDEARACLGKNLPPPAARGQKRPAAVRPRFRHFPRLHRRH